MGGSLFRPDFFPPRLSPPLVRLLQGDWLPDRFYVYESIHRTAARLLNFDAIYDGYVASDPTPERFLDTLTRLEREVFQIHQPQPKGDRTVLIQVGEPVNLKDHYGAFQRHREATLEGLREGLRQQLQRGLDRISTVGCR